VVGNKPARVLGEPVAKIGHQDGGDLNVVEADEADDRYGRAEKIGGQRP
jgi:hypothetical protein